MKCNAWLLLFGSHCMRFVVRFMSGFLWID